MPDKKPFVFNDENKYNSYGFRTANAGIDLSRFNDNPVMLDGHWADNCSVIGRWENFGIQGSLLTGIPVFDTEDEAGKMIAGKVERGFIKACSMGLLFNPEDMVLEPNGKWLLSKSELFEVSIVPIPSNANAIRLYVEKDGKYELMKEEEIKLCFTGLSENNYPTKNDNNNMKKVFLSAAALVVLGLDKATNPAEGVDTNLVEDAINNLKSKLDTSALKLSAAEAALKTYQDREAAVVQLEAKKLVDSAIPSKMDETERETMMKLAVSDYAFAKKLIDGIPAKTTLSNNVNNPSAPGANEVKTMDEFQKLDTAAQLAFKAANPDVYKKIVEAA